MNGFDAGRLWRSPTLPCHEPGFGFQISGFGFRVSGLGFLVSGFQVEGQDLGCGGAYGLGSKGVGGQVWGNWMLGLATCCIRLVPLLQG